MCQRGKEAERQRGTQRKEETLIGSVQSSSLNSVLPRHDHKLIFIIVHRINLQVACYEDSPRKKIRSLSLRR
eukprot:m.63214 g.63214  ORF g.63214 m.63214 type:complete len:72 (-) comp9652_c0_seq3:1183-1398(-)